jgi:hypothetical protein
MAGQKALNRGVVGKLAGSGVVAGDGSLVAEAEPGVRVAGVLKGDPVAALELVADAAVWVPNIVSPHATWAYSWMRPPSRSRR